jgi:transposase-like protein
MKNPNSKKRKKPTYLSADEKMEIVRFHYLEGGSYAQITKKYGIGHTAIGRILSNFAASNDKSALLMKKKKTDNQAEELSALKEEVMSLKKQLYDAEMRADYYDTMIDVAEEMFNIEIRKKAGAGQSKGCTKERSVTP